MPEVSPEDNHEQHLAVHAMATNTWGKWVHIEWHRELLAMQMKQQMEMQQQQMMGAPPGQTKGELPPEPIQPQVGVAKQNPKEAASSLRQATQQSISQNPITQ